MDIAVIPEYLRGLSIINGLTDTQRRANMIDVLGDVTALD